MTQRDFEMGLLALKAWQGAKSDDLMEILAVACVLRNRVLKYGKTYTAVLEESEVNRPWPSITHPLMIDPTNGLLAAVEGIYKNETPDLTSNHNFKNGACYFGRVQDHAGTGDPFDITVLQNQGEHPLIGQFGIQHFFV